MSQKRKAQEPKNATIDKDSVTQYAKKARTWCEGIVSHGLNSLWNGLGLRPLEQLAYQQQSRYGVVGAFPGDFQFNASAQQHTNDSSEDVHYSAFGSTGTWARRNRVFKTSDSTSSHEPSETQSSGSASEDSTSYTLGPFSPSSYHRGDTASLWGSRPAPFRSIAAQSHAQSRFYKGSHSHMDSHTVIHAPSELRPRLYSGKVSKRTALLQSKYSKDESTALERLASRYASSISAYQFNRADYAAALNQSTSVSETDSVDSSGKSRAGEEAKTSTVPAYDNRFRSIDKQDRSPAHQAAVDRHEEIEREVQQALSDGYGSVVEGFNVTITKNDIRTLRPGEWLNDEVINFYGQLIMARSNASSALPKVHVFSTFFYKTLSENGYDKVRRWTKKTNIFAKDYLLIPIHCSGNHWTSAVIDMNKKKISYYDSLLGNNPKCFLTLRNYLESESRDKLKKPFDFQGWENECPKNIPRQQNGFDCGVFTCFFIESKSRGANSFDFSQADMPYLRQKMVLDILNKVIAE
ncbi:SUMO1 sentrin specific peptidase 1 [Actinomortierella ambigua]|nr:SUMO1 sentrin specific peptidase 1 [Actinomortierella ambigua]